MKGHSNRNSINSYLQFSSSHHSAINEKMGAVRGKIKYCATATENTVAKLERNNMKNSTEISGIVG